MPSVKETVLLEASRVVLASLAATGVAAVLLFWVWLPLYRRLQAFEPTTVAESLPYLGAVVATSSLACALALGLSLWRFPRTAPIEPGRLWNRAFIRWVPEGGSDPYLIVELLDGTTWKGTFQGLDADPEDSQRNIALGGRLRRRKPNETKFSKISETGRVALLLEPQIRSIQVLYVEEPVEEQ